MKNLLFTFSIVLISFSIKAQPTTIPVIDYGSYNLGIGTTLLNMPTGNYNMGIGVSSLTALSSGTFNTAIGANTLNANTTGNKNVAVGFQAFYWNTTGSGNVGVGWGAGTSGPGVFEGNTLVGHETGWNRTTPYLYNTALGYKAGFNLVGNSNVMLGAYAGAYETGSNTFYLDNQDRGNTTNDKANALMYGNFAPTPADQSLLINAKLRVNGTIIATEIDVQANVWADNVFEPNYNLRSLGEIETFIKANKHLPEVPTNHEVKENGINIAKMNALLLKKVEELTLLMIEQNKTIKDLQDKVSEMEE